MSKIFDALRKTEGAVADVAMTVLGDPALIPPVAPVMDEPRETPPPIPTVPKPETRAEAIRIPAHSPMLPFDGSDVRAAEQYRIIRTKLRHHPEQPKLILVSSAMPGDGKTVSAANLAGVLALQDDVRVLLVDCDFRRSALTRLLGLDVSGTPGLGDVLRGEATLESSLIAIEQFPNLYILHPGDPGPNPSELLASARWRAMTELFRREFSFTILDAPPVGSVADYDSLQLASDGVVLIARPDYTNRKLWRKALETVPKPKQLGVILNCVKDWFLWKNHSYYYYSPNSK